MSLTTRRTICFFMHCKFITCNEHDYQTMGDIVT